MSDLPGGIRIGIRQCDGAWTGVLRQGRRIVVECGHRHSNRDWSTKASGTSASDCIRYAVRGARLPAVAASIAAQLRDGWKALAGRTYIGATTAARFRERGERDAAAYEAAVTATRALLASADAKEQV